MTKIYLAGGCFWGVEAYFQKLEGVLETRVGYIDGNDSAPTYEKVCRGIVTHAEAVMVIFDETKIPLETILEHFFYIIDPFSVNKQGNDKGAQYRTGIYGDKMIIEFSKNFIKHKFGNDYLRVQTHTKIDSIFYLAEDYHQKYLDKNPGGYCHINLDDVYEGK